MLKKPTAKNILTFLGLISCLIWLVVFSFPDNRLHVIFCDVGQGDATLITKGFNQILIDAGPNDKVLTCLKNNLPFWDKKIEMTILTHPEADHMTGFIAVLDKYDIGYFLLGPETGNSVVYEELVKKIEIEVGNGKCEAGIGSGKCDNPESLTSHLISIFSPPTSHITKVINPYAGDKIKIGNIMLTSLWPDREWVANNVETRHAASLRTNNGGGVVLGLKTTHAKLNDFSLVFLLTYNSNNVETGHAPSLQTNKNIKRILLMGDADERVHDKFIDNLTALPIDILKFPHHGSKTGMEKDTLIVLKPKEAVISVGKNSYGHPTKEALDLLREFNVTIRRTDLEGEIKYTF